MKKKLPIFYYDETYQINVWFMLGWQPKRADDFLRGWFSYGDLDLDTKAGRCIYFQKDNGAQAIVIWIREKITTPYWIGTLAHECVHAANMVFANRGVKPDLDNDEPQAYLVAALVRKALGFKYTKHT